MHMGSYAKMSDFVDKYLTCKFEEELSIFDLGSQDVNGSYKKLFTNEKWDYVGCDMVDGKNVDLVLKDIYDWTEVDSNSIDVVVCGQVFEHVEYFWNTIMEIVRVMKEDGLCCIIAPGICPEHRYPVDCWRYYPDGFKTIAKFAGVEILEVYTAWQDISYPDGSSNSTDSVLIFRKPKLSESEKLKLEKKIEIVKSLAKDYEININEIK